MGVNRLFLSLGSNQGDRLNYLQQAINAIRQSIGKPISVSLLYESAAWGFEADNFFNCCLLVETTLSASCVLHEIQSIEKSLGRVRTSSDTYDSRTIDIDIVFYNEEIINKTDLIIPHPKFRDRNFVLYPLNDLSRTFRDPISNLTIEELKQKCLDKGHLSTIDETLFI